MASLKWAIARSYLRSRGYDGDVVRKFQLGWAPDDWDVLARTLKVSDDLLRDTGLGFVNRRQRQQDASATRFSRQSHKESQRE